MKDWGVRRGSSPCLGRCVGTGNITETDIDHGNVQIEVTGGKTGLWRAETSMRRTYFKIYCVQQCACRSVMACGKRSTRPTSHNTTSSASSRGG